MCDKFTLRVSTPATFSFIQMLRVRIFLLICIVIIFAQHSCKMEKRKNRGNIRYVLKLRAGLLLHIYLCAFFTGEKEKEKSIICEKLLITFEREVTVLFFICANKFRMKKKNICTWARNSFENETLLNRAVAASLTSRNNEWNEWKPVLPKILSRVSRRSKRTMIKGLNADRSTILLHATHNRIQWFIFNKKKHRVKRECVVMRNNNNHIHSLIVSVVAYILHCICSHILQNPRNCSHTSLIGTHNRHNAWYANWMNIWNNEGGTIFPSSFITHVLIFFRSPFDERIKERINNFRYVFIRFVSNLVGLTLKNYAIIHIIFRQIFFILY